MNNAIATKTGRHIVFNLYAHLVFVTKYRKPVLNQEMLTRLKTIFILICNDFETELVQFNGEADHVHLMIHYPPQIALSNLVAELKGKSSYYMRKEFKQNVKKHY